VRHPFVALLFLLALATAAFAGEPVAVPPPPPPTVTWAGSRGAADADGKWADAGNWNPQRVPAANDIVLLPAGNMKLKAGHVYVFQQKDDRMVE